MWDGNGFPVKRCCARCRRGSLAYGLLPCGRDGECGCHKPEDARTGDNSTVQGLVHVDEKQASQIADSGNTHSEEIGHV